MQHPIDRLIDSSLIAALFACGVYLAMLGLAAAIVRHGEPRRLTGQAQGRIGALDGLRGVLALGVFAHHSVVSCIWASGGPWDLGKNEIVNQLGQTTVALFFMITGFLFAGKAVPPMHWARFYRGRIYRLFPLYAVFVLVIFAIVMGVTRELREPPATVGLELLQWFAFLCFGRPEINAYPNTWVIGAGVNWSLKYEVLFYVFVVPLLYGLNRWFALRTRLIVVLLLFVVVALLRTPSGVGHNSLFYGLHFLAGIAVAYAYAIGGTRRWLEGSTAKVLGLTSVALLTQLPDATRLAALVATLFVFAAVVGNASVFGLLKTRAAIWLGEISYGIYLLHGLLLWISYRLFDAPKDLAAFFFRSLLVGFAVVLIASLSYLKFELPMMAAGRRSPNGGRIRQAA